MADTSKANILAIAAELSSVSDGTFDLVLADVALQITEAVFGARQEVAQRYLAAHRLTVINGTEKGGAVVSERTGDVATSYAAPGSDDYNETAYGREFARICKGCVAGFMVVTP